MSDNRYTPPKSSLEDWAKAAGKLMKGKPVDSLKVQTAEGIELSPLYTAEDISGSATKDTLPGLEPYIRGPQATMYAGRPWTIRQYAGFSTAEESNAFYHQLLSEGAQGISVAFDLATHRGYDSDHERAIHDVGKAGVAVDSVEDMKLLFDGIPLDQVSVSMTMNGSVLPILAGYIVAAEEQGVAQADLSGTIQNDILKEFLVRNTYIYPPGPSMRIVGDIIAYCTEHMPRFNTISISGYHIQEAGADAALELAYTLADGKEYIRCALAAGLDIDDFAPRLSFFWGIGMNFYMEIAKLRAARLLWSRIVDEFNPGNPRSKMLRTHSQTSGWSLTEQDPHNNVVRTTIEAMAAVFGGTQSLHTNALDEAIALPSESSARLARNTQLILQEETGITDVIDPWGGSYMMESLTSQLADRAWDLIVEIEDKGGMASAIETGLPKLRIESAAAKRQAQIDNGEQVIVGVNKYQTKTPDQIEVLEIENSEVLKKQLDRLAEIRIHRDEQQVQTHLKDLREAADNNSGNLLDLAVIATRARATGGEITLALEDAYSRYEAETRTVSGVYGEAMNDDQSWQDLTTRIKAFTAENETAPAILVCKLGQDGHDRGAKVIASSFADAGFRTALTPMFSLPKEVVDQAIREEVHAIGVSSLAGAHKTMVPDLLAELKAAGADHIVVVVGGVIPKQDYGFLYNSGVHGVFGPGTPVTVSSDEVLSLIEARTSLTRG
ncbi:MAG: methylmalonyl-CoA mutase [OM182 bacterium MED-G24]|uniref:Methylmalonyl-CoA mutase n=1 Tax=OM182 bacterium MED-G24 TaxID=1986255 RepID=A0A2A5WWM2_9GAMM|nr:MAG: methylmalonyl-CoA mutase [OM182 bacterium MED-G24]|tara:strand:+ start:12320 stop:14488 length:2169 start_codon:yes stop_codon:yes gene_type:complete